MHAEDKPKKEIGRGWVWAARFPCLLLVAWLVILPGIAVSTILLTDAKNLTIESDFESYLSSDEPASTEYDELEAILADYDAPTAADSSRRRALQTTLNPDGSAPEVTWRAFIEIIYYCGENCDTIFTENRIESIHDFEMDFEADMYSGYCPRKEDSADCVEAESILNYFYPTVTSSGLVLDGNGDSMLPIDSVISLIQSTAQDESDLWFFPRDFIEDGANISIVRSSFEFRYRDEATMTSMMRNDLLPYLSARKHLADNLRVAWYNSNMNTIEIEELILHDLQFGIISLAFVLGCMVVHSRSLFLSIVACFSIAMSFPITYVIYTVPLGNSVMMIFNFTSVFVLVGIGADDFAIFSDIWAQSRHLPDFDMANRLRWTWRRAAGATFVTSVTTAASFLANLASPIQPIREFGQFMGVLVIANYIFIIVVLPPALVIQDRYLRWDFFSCCRRRLGAFRKSSSDQEHIHKDTADERYRAMGQTPTSSASTSPRSLGSNAQQGSSGASSPRKPHAVPSFAALLRPSLWGNTDTSSPQESNGECGGLETNSVVSEDSVTIDVSEGRSSHGRARGATQATVPSYNSDDLIDEHDFLVRGFYKRVAPFTYRCRYALVALFIVLTASLGGVMVGEVEMSDGLPDIFGTETNIGLLLEIRTNYFSDTSVPNSATSETDDPATVAICVDENGEEIVCSTPAPTSQPTTETSPTPQPTSPPVDEPTTSPTSSPEPTVAPVASTPVPTASPTPEPTPFPVTPQPTTIIRPSNIPAQVLIADGSTLVPHFGDDGPENGFIEASTGVREISSNLCASFAGEPTSGTAALAVEAGTAATNCTLAEKLSNSIDEFPSTQVLIAVHGADTGAEDSVEVSNSFAITVEDGAPLAAVRAASSLTYGPPLLVTFTTDGSRRLQGFSGPPGTGTSASDRTAAEVLADANIDSSVTFSDGSGSTSVIILSYAETDAESLGDELRAATDVNAVEVDDAILAGTPRPTSPPQTPTQSPTVQTSSPTMSNAPTTFSTANPTSAPTFVCECSGNGDCASDATAEDPLCSCYAGWLGDTCNTTDPTYSELSDDQVSSVDIWWSEDDVENMADTQLAMTSMCTYMANEVNSSQNLLEVRRVTNCFMTDFASYVEDQGQSFPIEDSAGFAQTLYSFVTTTSTGYQARNFALFNEDGSVKLVRMKVLTNINELLAASEADPLYLQWEASVKAQSAQATQSSFLWARTQTELAVIRGTLTAALISVAFAFAAIFVFTRFNITVAIVTTLAIVIVLILLLSVLIVFMGRAFGAIEALSVIILAGLTVDYSLHLAHSFHRARHPNMFGRAQQALGQTGPSVIFGAATTAGAAAILTVCEITLFNDFGMIIAINTALSLVTSIFFLIPALLVSYAAMRTVMRCLRRETRDPEAKRRRGLPEATDLPESDEGGNNDGDDGYDSVGAESDNELCLPPPPPAPPPSPRGKHDNIPTATPVFAA
ncbi:Protein dispatched-like 1 [Hondaea fermentalgiana]|uniref:Protein dispatched-like 1 n=1 Tax=Hondaea fermentalgiana TaxID=2315210 RepID=A0A2R5GQ09_9STRA|nr:Protein dispatched-like 1 [Hondaea fermentalgiana]|eukprot:GBG30703.1 Protein dispatched-like 1 [Hondaea fermentalgiana]